MLAARRAAVVASIRPHSSPPRRIVLGLLSAQYPSQPREPLHAPLSVAASALHGGHDHRTSAGPAACDRGVVDCAASGPLTSTQSEDGQAPRGRASTPKGKLMMLPWLRARSSQLADEAQLAQDVANAMVSRGVRVVVFDMDQTMVSKHSMGNLKRSRFEWFAEHTTSGFLALVPKLSAAGIKLAIGTASDKAEYSPPRKTPSSHMLGEDLVEPLLKAVVPDHAAEFFVVAYNPRARQAEGKLPENQGKLRHVREVCAHYELPQGSALLLDDDDSNHRKHNGVPFYSVKVSGRHGLQLAPLLQQLQVLPAGGGYVPMVS